MKYGGVLGPAAFLVAVILVAFLRGDYSHTGQLMSELGETGGAYSAIFNYAGFFVAGVSIILFAIFLRGELSSFNLSVAAAVLIGIHGAGMLFATWARCDTGCPAEGSASQLAHNIIAGIKFPALLLASLILGIQFIRNNISKSVGWLSILAFLVSLVLMAKFTISAELRENAGLWQRAFLAVIYSWLMLVSIFLARRPKARTPMS